MVYQSILNIFKKYAIPFGVTSTTTLFSTFQQAKAQTIGEWLYERGNVKNNPFSKENLKEEGALEKIKESLSQWNEINSKILESIDWINHLPEHIPKMTIQLLSWIYELLSKFILITPVWLFQNAWFSNTTLMFSMVSVAVVIILTIIESLKKMYKFKKVSYTKFHDILKRFPLAVAGAGFAPFAYTQLFEWLNKLSQSISSIGREYITQGSYESITLSKLDIAAIIGFDLILITLLFPIFLKNGRRWFDLIALGTMTPLALSAWIFDDYRHLFNKWWKHIKHLSFMQITYAIFICLLGILIFGTKNFTGSSISVFFVKLMVIAGGLWRLANPPIIVLSASDSAKDSWSIGKELFNTFTLKKFSPLDFVKKEIYSPLKAREERRRKAIQELRRQTGKRYNK
ncbi:hypothetical protein ABEV41_00340 [Geobacillus thermodenitrificans]|uniref:hypothetical protein n=1 Tax=Geobacillus thermodenitrificans TaxID=33940 RepID=UPI003D25BF10